MTQPFRRTGELMALTSYPAWLQELVLDTNRDKNRIANSEFFRLMRDARLPVAAMQKFLIGAWPTIEQFPRFMANNLRRIGVGDSPGEDMARRFLIHNIRVEQKHADLWLDWASSVGLTLSDLKAEAMGDIAVPMTLTHFCHVVCDSGSVAEAIAATNYAVEGLTGDWSCLVCSKTSYADSIPELRIKATRWLRVHAHYDDAHSWEALDIIATLLGSRPKQQDVDKIHRAISRSYKYFEMGLSYPMAELLHGTFDETASNASTLGGFDTLEAAA
jgi:pyrroloquinoline quinone (PQQ) biosynthesis protein C